MSVASTRQTKQVEVPPEDEVQTRAEIRRLHLNDRAYFLLHNGMTLGYLGLMALAVWTWTSGYWPLTLLCWALGGHIGHAKLIAFHESSHATLNSKYWLNELQGIGIGTVILVPLSVYRYVHGQHHAYLGTPKDLELWPFVKPGAPRVLRVLAAFGELVLGFFYTPVVFLHGVLVGGNIPPWQKTRIKLEYALCAVVWAVMLTTVAIKGWWVPLVVGYLVPACIAGNLQSLRKFTEHLGLTGDTILSITRTVVDKSQVGEFMSESMLHIDYHGTHHRYAKVPYYNLPATTPYVYADDPNAPPVFTNYWAAMWDMAKSLGNPRVGPQWR